MLLILTTHRPFGSHFRCGCRTAGGALHLPLAADSEAADSIIITIGIGRRGVTGSYYSGSSTFRRPLFNGVRITSTISLFRTLFLRLYDRCLWPLIQWPTLAIRRLMDEVPSRADKKGTNNAEL